MFKVSKTYEVVTPESAEYGDFAETGFVFQDRLMDLKELIREIREGGFTGKSNGYTPNNGMKNYTYLVSEDADINYSTDEDTYYNLHIDCTNKQFNKICELAGIQ